MPQIPGVPTIQPVNQPMMSPGEAARPGETVERLGQEGEQIAQVGMGIAERLQDAQRQVSLGQGEVALGHTENQFYDALAKAGTPEEVDTLFNEYPKKVDEALASHEKDPHVARVLHQYSEHQSVIIENAVNARKADILTKSDAANRVVLGETYKQEGITEKLSGGDGSIAEGKYELMLSASEKIGTILPAVAERDLQTWRQDVQMGTVEARMNDPHPSKRKDLINQLKSGKGPLVDGLPEAIRNHMHTAAVSKNEELTTREEAQDVNTIYGNAKGYFQTHKDLYPNGESKLAATDDPEFLKAINSTTPDGQADFVMGKKLRAFVEPMVAHEERVALDKANKDRDEIVGLFSKGQLPQGLAKAKEYLPDFQNAHTDYYPAIVNMARSWATFERGQATAERGVAVQERVQARQAWQDRSDQTTGEISRRILDGEKLDLNKDIWSLAIGKEPKLTPRNAQELEMMYKQSPQGGKEGAGDPGYKLLTETLPKPEKGGDLQDSARINLDNFLTTQAYQAFIKEKPRTPEEKLKFADTLTQQNVQKVIGRMIDKQILSITNPEAIKEFKEIGITLPVETTQFTEGSQVYNIPNGRIEDFKKVHPNAR